MRKIFILSTYAIILIELLFFKYWQSGLWSLMIFGPYLLVGLHDLIQKKHSMLRNFYFNKSGIENILSY